MPIVAGGRRLRDLGPVVVSTALLAGFYFWTASDGLPLGLGQPHDQHYNLLTEALFRGQLHIPVQPRPELFELTQPYRPGRNAAYRYQDASLYRGRYYLYFGVVPALVAFAPWRLVGLGDLPEPAAAAAFALVGFAFSALLLRHLLSTHLRTPPRALAQVLAFVILGLSNVAPFILRSSHVYEVAIAAGYAFSAGAAWLFATAGAGDTFSWRRLALGGLFLGLAVGCRPNLVLLVPFLPLLAVSRGSPGSWRGVVRPALAVLGPLLLCGLALGLYNHARFDSWTEFGTRYQLGAEPVPLLEPRAVIPTLYYHFLAPPSFRLDFPFVFPGHDWAWTLPDGYFLDQSTTGALAHSPFLLILVALPWVLRGAPVREPEGLRRQLLLLVAAGIVVPLVTAIAFASVAMRFQVDFMHLLLVPSLVLWFVLVSRLHGRPRRLVRGLAAIVFGWSAIAAVALSITAAYPLRRSNPALFASLEQWAEPLRLVMGRLLARGGHLEVPLRVAFPERLASEREPFLSWGPLEAFDVLWVKTVSPGVFSLSLDTAARRSRPGPAPPATPGRAFVPGRFYDVVVDIDRVRRRVRVTADGQERFVLEGRLVPAVRRHVWPGRGPRGHGAPDLGRFSGTMIPEDMWLAGPPGLESLPPIAAKPARLTRSRAAGPGAAKPGQLWVVAGRRGAYIFANRGWRWIPTASVEALELERRIRELPKAPAGGITPILVSGNGAGADAVVVRHRGGGKATIAYARWEGSWTLGAESPPLSRADVVGGALRVVLDRREWVVVVSLEDDEVLRTRVELQPLRPRELSIGGTPWTAREITTDETP